MWVVPQGQLCGMSLMEAKKPAVILEQKLQIGLDS